MRLGSDEFRYRYPLRKQPRWEHYRWEIHNLQIDPAWGRIGRAYQELPLAIRLLSMYRVHRIPARIAYQH